MKKILIIGILLILAMGGAFLIGKYSAVSSPEYQITEQTIIRQIQDQAFLVTKTLFLDESVTITVAQSQGFKGFFIGDELEARGLVRVDVGVDLQNLAVEDVMVDHQKKQVIVYLPESSILDSSLYGELDVKSKKGIWTSIKDLISDEEGTDYNEALKQVVERGKQSARLQQNVFAEARAGSAGLVSLVVEQLLPEYEVEAK